MGGGGPLLVEEALAAIFAVLGGVTPIRLGPDRDTPGTVRTGCHGCSEGSARRAPSFSAAW